MALRLHIGQTTASLSVPLAADSYIYGLPASNMCATTCYNVLRLRDGAFAAAGQRLWNSLPAELRQLDVSLGQFRRALKTHFFC